MSLTPEQTKEVESVISKLVTKSWWNGPVKAREVIGKLIADRDAASATANLLTEELIQARKDKDDLRSLLFKAPAHQ